MAKGLSDFLAVARADLIWRKSCPSMRMLFQPKASNFSFKRFECCDLRQLRPVACHLLKSTMAIRLSRLCAGAKRAASQVEPSLHSPSLKRRQHCNGWHSFWRLMQYPWQSKAHGLVNLSPPLFRARNGEKDARAMASLPGRNLQRVPGKRILSLPRLHKES